MLVPFVNGLLFGAQNAANHVGSELVKVGGAAAAAAIGVHDGIHHLLGELQKRIPPEVFAVFDAWWKSWEQQVPAEIRALVYGALVGLVLYAVLNTAGFTAAGIAAGSLAASIQSLIGNVTRNSVFAALQSVGAQGPLALAWQAALTNQVVGSIQTSIEHMKTVHSTG